MEEIKAMKMPTGFRFRPSEEELINYYLKPKNLGQALPCNIVQEKPLYSGNPWQVLDVRDQENKWQVSETKKVIKMTIYVFTKLTKKKHAAGAGERKKEAAGGGGREQFVRAAGCGTWDGQTGPKEIKNGKGGVIGFKKMLVFKIGGLNPSTSTSSVDETNNPGHWISHEYSLPGGEWEYVLCEITLHLKKSSEERKCSEDLEEIIFRKSSSPRVEFGTGNCEGDVGVNNYMEVVAHPVEISILESSTRIEGASNGEVSAGADCNYMEVIPQPIAAIGRLYGDGGQPAAVEDDNELMLMMIEELGGSQIQQPLAGFGYDNGGQYQANDEQLMMMSGNDDNQIQQPLEAFGYDNGGQYQANDEQLMMMSGNDDNQIQQPLAAFGYVNGGQYQANDEQLMMMSGNDDNQIQQSLEAFGYDNGGQYQANDEQLMMMSGNDDNQIQQPLEAFGYDNGGQYQANDEQLMMMSGNDDNQIQQPLAAFGYVNGGQYQANDEQLMMMSHTGIWSNDDDQIQQPLAAIDYGNRGQYQTNDSQLMMTSHTGIWSNDDDQIQQPLAAIDYGNGGQYQANDNQLMMMSHTGIWSNDDDQNQQWDGLLSMKEILNPYLF